MFRRLPCPGGRRRPHFVPAVQVPCNATHMHTRTSSWHRPGSENGQLQAALLDRLRTKLLCGRPRPRRPVVSQHRWLRGADLPSGHPAHPLEGTGAPCPSAQAVGRPSLCLRRKYTPCRERVTRSRESGTAASAARDGLLNRGVMPIPQLNVYRHDRGSRALLTLAGEIDLDTAPIVRESLEKCLSDGIRTIDVDLTTVTFCDCSGLNTLLHASQQTAAAGGSLQLHYPPPLVARLVDLTGSGFLLLGLPFGHLEPPMRDAPAATATAPPQLLAPLACPLGRCAVMAWSRQRQPRNHHGPDTSATDAVRLRRLNRWQAEDLCEELADLYVESSDLRPSEGYRSRSREEFLHRLSGDIRRPGFAMVIAESTALVGCAFGFRVRSDDLGGSGSTGHCHAASSNSPSPTMSSLSTRSWSLRTRRTMTSPADCSSGC
ncbi:STAS domain-containing protein [Streptomyces sp. NPDC020681]|uniref:STAS domain-containing protein n=1 Tax=Streptomyces sp. NPDC020681 TaxID=3365083 RepID=UPI0037B0018F